MEDSVIDKLLEIYSSYASCYRSSIQPYKLKLAEQKKLDTDFGDIMIRESLLEHVGHLPITAIILHKYIQSEDVDLGKALIMLGIHDIGELKVGDKAIFIKSEQDHNAEVPVALAMLDESLHEYYMDIDEQRTSTGKFAKSVDKIVGDVLDLLVPTEISIERYASMGIVREKIVTEKRDKKLKYMLWDPFLANFYEILLKRLEQYFA